MNTPVKVVSSRVYETWAAKKRDGEFYRYVDGTPWLFSGTDSAIGLQRGEKAVRVTVTQVIVETKVKAKRPKARRKP